MTLGGRQEALKEGGSPSVDRDPRPYRHPPVPIPFGFTLLELLVVLVIIATLSAFVGPRLLGSMGGTQLRVASKKVATSLRYARTQAVSEGVVYVAVLDVESGRITIKSRRPATGWEEKASGGDGNAGEKKKTAYDLPEGIKLEKIVSGDTEVDSGAPEVLFFPTGGSSGARIVLASERGQRRAVVVDFITGTVHVEDPEE